MIKLKKIPFIPLVAIGFLSFKFMNTENAEFSYPDRENTTITLKNEGFKTFKKEWQGTDYYYSGENKNGIICSVLFYKLTEDEQESLVIAPRKMLEGPEISPAYPYAFFSNYSNLKKYEKNNTIWGKPTDNFMFRQNDVPEYNGMKIKQKHMYGYAMVDKDLFVNVHLSKTSCTTEDSTAMRNLLNSLSRKTP